MFRQVPIDDPGSGGSDSGTDVITTSTEAPRIRTAPDLSAQIKQAGGALIVGPNDSRYIVAVNNSLRYSVTPAGAGQFRITESLNFMYLIAAAVILGIVILSRR